MDPTIKLTKKQKRLLRTQNGPNTAIIDKMNFKLKQIDPLTENQKLVFSNYAQGKHLLLHGLAGTGKSFLSIYLSLKEIINNANSAYKKLYIIRSAVSTRDVGFMPGKIKDKAGVYEAPYHYICNKLFERSDAYDYLKQKGIIEFMTTSFIRGITLDNCIIIVDEMANLNLHELDSVITRVGDNCKIIFCGDFSQTDFTKESEKRGLPDFMRIIDKMKSFGRIEFDNEEDIVRSGIIREYLTVKHRLGIKT